MKAVLISIQPKWIEKICKGEKTIEVRKTKPNLETPFKCYIYCTKGTRSEENKYGYIGQGHVICEFTCDNIEKFNLPMPAYFSEVSNNIKELLREACLSMSEAHHYIDDKDGYGWHISDLEIYDKPKELSEFKLAEYNYGRIHLPPREITRPFQSWGYVEAL